MEWPTSRLERRLFRDGATVVAGVDEVGRGAWAGPVSVGVALLTRASLRRIPEGVADSKLLRPAQREELFAPLAAALEAFAVGHASSRECDELGMTAAQRLAAERAFAELGVGADVTVLDGKVDYLKRPGTRPVIGADRTCVVVAAASVLAKVTRDAHMAEIAPRYAPYGFERNKGYPSPLHRAAIAERGLTDIHRASWSFASGQSLGGDDLGQGAQL